TRGLRNLNKANSSLDTALQRLSTGSQINSGKDNPSGLIAGEKLRLQVTTIEQSIKNSNRASNVIATADGALGEISGLLNQVRGLVQEGLNSGALSDTEIEANQLQVDAALSAINRITANTTFGGDKLIDGSKGYNSQITAANAAKLNDFQVNELFFGSSSSVAVNATINSAAEKGSLTTSGFVRADTTLEVGGKDGNQVLFFDTGASLANVATAINAVSDATGVAAAVTGSNVAGTGTATATTETVVFTEAAGQVGSADEVVVTFTQGTGASVATSVSSVSGSGTGTITVAIELGTSAGSAANATAADITAAITASTDASAVISAVGAGTTDVFGAGDGPVTVNTSKAVQTLTLTSTDFGSSAFAEVNVLSGVFVTQDADSNLVSRDEGTDIVATINGSRAYGDGLKASLRTATIDVNLIFDSAANTDSNTASFTVTGGGANFQIGENVSANGQIGLGIEAVNTARLGGVSGKLYELGTGGGKSLLDVGPSVQGSALVNIVDEALDRVSTIRGRLGAIQKNVIETNIATLGVALENISEARSQIVDTDFATETANLTKSQILSQAGISVLSIANQQPQQVLALLG
ncbi:MAG: flagellin, partial [Planctomycetota bacterium]|nr:flagellin [Planctomycetota bacterium]